MPRGFNFSSSFLALVYFVCSPGLAINKHKLGLSPGLGSPYTPRYHYASPFNPSVPHIMFEGFQGGLQCLPMMPRVPLIEGANASSLYRFRHSVTVSIDGDESRMYI